MRIDWIGAAGLTLALALPGAASAGGRPPAADRFDTVVIDAGHGGDDEGAEGPGGLFEKDVVLDVARRLAAELRQRQLRVVLTRDGDRFVSLERRTAIANDARADLFVSIHANSAPDRSARGVETYFLSLAASDDAARGVALRENGAFGEAAAIALIDDPVVAILGDLAANEYQRESDVFARMAIHALSDQQGRTSRGVKQAPFVVLSGVQMPAALVEIGFITNRRDRSLLESPRGRRGIADALAGAIGRYGERHDALRGVGRAPEAGPERRAVEEPS